MIAHALGERVRVVLQHWQDGPIDKGVELPFFVTERRALPAARRLTDELVLSPDGQELAIVLSRGGRVPSRSSRSRRGVWFWGRSGNGAGTGRQTAPGSRFRRGRRFRSAGWSARPHRLSRFRLRSRASPGVRRSRANLTALSCCTPMDDRQQWAERGSLGGRLRCDAESCGRGRRSRAAQTGIETAARRTQRGRLRAGGEKEAT